VIGNILVLGKTQKVSKMTLRVTISEKGQIVIPAALRKRYGLAPGDKLAVVDKNGEILLRPLPRHPLINLRGKYRTAGTETLTAALLRERRAERALEKESYADSFVLALAAEVRGSVVTGDPEIKTAAERLGISVTWIGPNRSS
jgi:AbrB family looped-hinge helix DNA binding protein